MKFLSAILFSILLAGCASSPPARFQTQLPDAPSKLQVGCYPKLIKITPEDLNPDGSVKDTVVLQIVKTNNRNHLNCIDIANAWKQFYSQQQDLERKYVERLNEL